MGYDAAKYDEIVARAKALCGHAFVAGVDDHYAIYWGELGLTVRLHNDAQDADVIGLRNALLALLKDLLPEGSPDFTWIAAFKRRGKTIEVIDPGNQPRDPADTLVPI